MILNLNHLHGESAGATAEDVVETVYKLVEEGQIAPGEFANLRIQLDWIQYKQNFREVVSVAQGSNQRGPIMDVHIDTRQVVPGCLRDGILRAMARANPTRFCMPPDNSAGHNSPTSGGSPTAASFFRAISLASVRGVPRPWMRPKATFSQTFRLSNSAEP